MNQSGVWPFSQMDFKYSAAQIIAVNAIYPLGPPAGNPIMLKDNSFYTSDSAVYVLENGEPILYFGTQKINPILKDMAEAIRQLTLGENYLLSGNDLTNAVNSEHAIRIPLSELELMLSNKEWGSFNVPTDKIDRVTKMNPIQSFLAEKVYGEKLTKLHEMTLKLFRNWEVIDLYPTQIFTLTPDYVKMHVPDNCGIARLCKLGNYSYNCVFGTVSRIQQPDDVD